MPDAGRAQGQMLRGRLWRGDGARAPVEPPQDVFKGDRHMSRRRLWYHGALQLSPAKPKMVTTLTNGTDVQVKAVPSSGLCVFP